MAAAPFRYTLVDADLANNSGVVAVDGAIGRRCRPLTTPAAPTSAAGSPSSRGSRPRTSTRRGRALPRSWPPAGVTLGTTYPYPCVDLNETGRRALADYRALAGRQERR